jgi:hypothetical protein
MLLMLRMLYFYTFLYLLLYYGLYFSLTLYLYIYLFVLQIKKIILTLSIISLY